MPLAFLADVPKEAAAVEEALKAAQKTFKRKEITAKPRVPAPAKRPNLGGRGRAERAPRYERAASPPFHSSGGGSCCGGARPGACNNCGVFGHWADNCPKARKSAFQPAPILERSCSRAVRDGIFCGSVFLPYSFNGDCFL
jgi:hypothetical protein